MEAARRSADISARKGVQFHVVDPGFMKTSYYHTALGLGSARRWKRWQAKRFGADPYKVAGFIEMIVRSEVFEHVNGLYVKCVKGLDQYCWKDRCDLSCYCKQRVACLSLASVPQARH